MDRPLAIWATPQQAPLLAAMARAMGATITAAATPVRAHSTILADALRDPSTTIVADLFDLLADETARVVLLATSCDAYGPALPQAVAKAAAAGKRIASMWPLPMPPGDAAGPWHEPVQGRVPAEAVRIGPLLRHGPAAQEADETLAAFGPVRSAMFAGYRDATLAGHGATGALLVDALDLLVGVLGEAERVEAALTGPGKPAVGLALGEVTGDLTAHARFEGGASAVVMLSDRAGSWSRRATLLGEAGRLELGDDGHRWIDPAGKTIDSTERRTRGHSGDADQSQSHDRAAIDALSAFLLPHFDGRATPPLDTAHLGPMAAAVLLSARTGQAESPSTLRAMV